ncbi:hypothetical protein KEM55_002396 [Ascosphaera atra]|nr:hypothetical protein KEM55_002396 [Ascosphaera atra]
MRRTHPGAAVAAAHMSAATAPPPSIVNPTTLDTTVHLSFTVPFSSDLAGPDPEEVLHASPNAMLRWLFPPGTPEGTPTHKLPVHAENVEGLKRLCAAMSDGSAGRVEATVTTAEPKHPSVGVVPPALSLQRRPRGQITNVCISSDGETAHNMRARILKETPIALRCAYVDVNVSLLLDENTGTVRDSVLEHIDTLAAYTGADIFLLAPKVHDTDSAVFSTYGPIPESLDNRFRIAIYADIESTEHAKTRVLIMIDQILKRRVDLMELEISIHSLLCGRTRRNIKMIEASTNTAIYFPPPFPRVFGFTPLGAHRRSPDVVYITGDTAEDCALAKTKLYALTKQTKIYVKDVTVNANKIDNILLERLDKVKKVMEANGSHVLFPQLGSRQNVVCIQGTEVLHVERTVREIMALAGQFYSASWWIILMDPTMRIPTPAEVRTMLSDICINSGADVSFEKLSFCISGSDEAVKAAMMVISQIPFVKRSHYQMRVKIELANEHKEFVSGKKNGKINKIMGQSNVQIIFDGFNEYNFYIDVCGSQYEATKNGLDLVEQEMPASISFHVPDQYHKRIIGIGGQHIQRIMKKYSVFVKFSNAMDRGGIGKEDDDIKVDNVICRTPARNAQSLDLVKQEIMDMVEKADAEFVSETVSIDRLYHRQLITRFKEIEALEKTWNCKIDFPSTELASDIVTISGPEYQVTQAVDAFLRMVPESHELSFQSCDELREYFASLAFTTEVRVPLKEASEVEVFVETNIRNTGNAPGAVLPLPQLDRIVLRYTRNNSGGVKDAIDFLISRLVSHGLDASTVKGAIPRPKSDSFENSLPFFDSKLLQHAPAPLVTEPCGRQSLSGNPSASMSNLTAGMSNLTTGNGHNGGAGNANAKGTDGEENTTNTATTANSDRSSLFGRLRKPGSISSFSSLLIGRKTQSNSPGSLFKQQASSNASKASLVSLESRDSASYRNPWNDSGVNLTDDDILTPGNNNNNAGPGNANAVTNASMSHIMTPGAVTSSSAMTGPAHASAGPPAAAAGWPLAPRFENYKFPSFPPPASASASASGPVPAPFPGPVACTMRQHP